jgi:Cu/Zn superoxide dismutase
MQFNRIVLAAAAALFIAAPLVANAKAESKTYPISAQNGSGETGSVTLTAAGADSTVVSVSLTGAPAAAQPAHIHPGSCANLNPAPKYPLGNLVSGKSTTTVPASLASLTAGGFAVNVHKSTDDLKDYVACGDLGKSMMMAPSHMMAAPTSTP